MVKFTWLTDIHLDHLQPQNRTEFYEKVAAHEGERVLITGDIANSRSTPDFLKDMAMVVQKPIYYVLGNHDFYGSHIEDVYQTHREINQDSTNQLQWIHWMGSPGEMRCFDGVLIIGVDGWADGGYASDRNRLTFLSMNDHRHIKDFVADPFVMSADIPAEDKWDLWKRRVFDKRTELAQRDDKKLRDHLDMFELPSDVLILTHIPPFPENALHRGFISRADKLPYYASKTMGDTLLEYATKFPATTFTVLCGHAHDQAYHSPLPNLHVFTGSADYGRPIIQDKCELNENLVSEGTA